MVLDQVVIIAQLILLKIIDGIVNSLLRPFFYNLLKPVNNVLPAAPWHDISFELSRFGLMYLLDQPMHREVAPWKGHITWSQCQRRTEIVGTIAYIKHSLIEHPSSFEHPLSHVAAHNLRLAHVFWASLATVGMKGTKL